MVTKGNKSRKTSKKIDSPSEKPEVNLEEVMSKLTQKVQQQVVDTLRPDLQKKIEEISQQLSKQLQTEMKDLRSQITPPQESTDETPPSNYTVPPVNNPSMPVDPSQNQNQIAQILPMLMQALRPNNSGQELMNMYIQTSLRKVMSKATYADWFQEAMMKKMATDYLGTQIPDTVQKSSDHFMKPIRDIGVRAEQKQQSENKQ